MNCRCCRKWMPNDTFGTLCEDCYVEGIGRGGERKLITSNRRVKSEKGWTTLPQDMPHNTKNDKN